MTSAACGRHVGLWNDLRTAFFHPLLDRMSHFCGNTGSSPGLRSVSPPRPPRPDPEESVCAVTAREQGSGVRAGASVSGEQPERGAVRWNGDVRRATAAGWLLYYLTVVKVSEEGGAGSVLHLIFHTPASYKQLSYTTLAPNNQPGGG